MLVEEGVKDFGGTQGDLEYIKFDRNNFGDALIRAIDYVLAVTSVPLQSRVEGNNIHITMGDSTSPREKIEQLRKAKSDRPLDVGVRLTLATLLQQTGDNIGAIRELEHAKTDFPNNPDVNHQLGHLHQDSGDLSKAIQYYEKSIELNSTQSKFYLCYAKALYEKSKNFDKPSRRRPVLEKSKRFLDQGLLIADPNMQRDMTNYLFLVDEALAEMKSTS